jgi:hypothetical protein
MPDITECIKIVDNLVSNISYEHEREAWQTLKSAVLGTTHNRQSMPCKSGSVSCHHILKICEHCGVSLVE